MSSAYREDAAALSHAAAQPERVSLWRLFTLFLRIGCTTWGGFMVFIAVVSKSLSARKIATEEDITDAIMVAQILPGPDAKDKAIVDMWEKRANEEGMLPASELFRNTHPQFAERGLPGAAVSWLGSVLPSFIVVTTLSILYLTYGSNPNVKSVFMAFPSAMVAIVAVAAYEMGRKQIKDAAGAAIGVLACLAIILQGIFRPGWWWVTLAIVFVAGFAGWLLYRGKGPKAAPPPAPAAAPKKALSIAPFGIALFPALGAGMLWKIFITFAVMSISLFGSGYVFIPIIKSHLVKELHWLTTDEFSAGLALTQITPGPILMTAAFVGVKMAGLPGAIAGTLGMFVPPAILTLIAAHSLQTIKKSTAITSALRGVRPAVVGMLFAAAIVVGESMPHDTVYQVCISAAILVAALIALIRLRVEVALVIPMAGIAGLVLFR